MECKLIKQIKKNHVVCFKWLCLLVSGVGLNTSHHPHPQLKDEGQRAELEGGWPLSYGVLEMLF